MDRTKQLFADKIRSKNCVFFAALKGLHFITISGINMTSLPGSSSRIISKKRVVPKRSMMRE